MNKHIKQTNSHLNLKMKTIFLKQTQWKLGITRSLRPRIFFFIYQQSINNTKQRKLMHWYQRDQFVISGILLYQISLYRVSTVNKQTNKQRHKLTSESQEQGDIWLLYLGFLAAQLHQLMLLRFQTNKQTHHQQTKRQTYV